MVKTVSLCVLGFLIGSYLVDYTGFNAPSAPMKEKTDPIEPVKKDCASRGLYNCEAMELLQRYQ